MKVTRFGLQVPNFTFPGVDDQGLFPRVAEIAVTAEESGFDSLWVMDHFYQIFRGRAAYRPHARGLYAARCHRHAYTTGQPRDDGDRGHVPEPGALGQDGHDP